MADDGDRRLAGTVTIVTGGNSGIGHATCRALAGQGGQVVVVDIDPARIDEVVRELAEVESGAGPHLGLACDVRSEGDMESMAARTLERFGRVDALVACAGVLRAPNSSPRPLVQVSVEEWERVIDTNLKGVFLSNRAVLPAMIERRQGDIINISSTSGRQGRAHDGPYCASKFGVIGLTESLADEVRNQGIRVQVLLPDAVATPFWQQNAPVPMPSDSLPPERVADLIVFMLSQPADTVLLSPVVAPLRSRRRVVGKRKAEA